MFIILIMVMLLKVFAYVQTYNFLHLKYVWFFVYQLHLSQVV